MSVGRPPVGRSRVAGAGAESDDSVAGDSTLNLTDDGGTSLQIFEKPLNFNGWMVWHVTISINLLKAVLHPSSEA